MKLGNTVFCLLLLGGLSTSCIREDLSDCFSTNTLLLSYKGDGETEIFGDKICRVEMYVFDAENRCVANGVLPPNEVEARAAKLPQLKPGDYRIVCLGNTHHTQVGNVASCDFSRITFADGGYFAGETVSGNDSLHRQGGRQQDTARRVRQLALRRIGRGSRYSRCRNECCGRFDADT